MGLLRSEDMKHGTLILPVERARYFMNLLGAGANIQFEDMHKVDQQRPYKRYVQRIDEMERILRFLRDAVERLPGWEGGIMSGDIEGFLAHDQEYSLDELEAELKRLDKEFRLLEENLAKVVTSRNQTTEEFYVASLASAFHTPRQRRRPSAPWTALPLQRPPSEHSLWAFDHNGHQFETVAQQYKPRFHDYGIAVHENAEDGQILPVSVAAVAGTIDVCLQARFERALFRTTRGNAFAHFHEIAEPMSGAKGEADFKSVFVIYYQNHIEVACSPTFRAPRRSDLGGSALHEKIMRVCKAFRAHVTQWYDNVGEAEAGKAQHERQMREQTKLLGEVRQYMKQEGRRLVERVRYPDGNSLIEEWRLFCLKEKSIYATLNLFEGNTNLRTSCWYPAAQEDDIRSLLLADRQSTSEGTQALCAMLVPDRSPPRMVPPTYFRKNEFTAVIQDLVDTYGIPRYKEANPMLFTTVTFPFLFGIMYGDVGHGSMLFIAGLLCCWKSTALRVISPDLCAARYLLVMMGFFSLYTGLLYSELFSLGFQIMESRWEVPAGGGLGGELLAKYDIRNEGGIGPYPFGLDPAWQAATNKMEFINSFKMKLSVILGVLQMMLGLLLRCANAFHEKSFIDFFCECLPMMVFLVCFLGFMDAMIVYKWVTPLQTPPSIVNSMICMMMRMTKDEAPMFGPEIPFWLLVAIGISVMCLLLLKPLLLWMRHQYCGGRGIRLSSAGLLHAHLAPYETRVRRGSFFRMLSHGSQLTDKYQEVGKEQFDLGEVITHQIIESIEYFLGTVSHAASYLRLWALSLAHGQLAEVFYEMTIGAALRLSFPLNGLMLYFALAVWLVITLGILLGMDVMECALHTLRLHWVEFQSKFFRGDGHPFMPFSHRAVLRQASE